MPLILNDKEMRSESRSDGSIGPVLRRAEADRIAEHIGDDLDWLPRQPIRVITEHSAHIAIGMKVSSRKTSYLVIPKSDVIFWHGALGRDLERARPDPGAAALMGGLVGVGVGKVWSKLKFAREETMPVIGLVYRAGVEEHSIYLEFETLVQHRGAQELFYAALPGLRRGPNS
jgi:hypothetical protein